MKNEGMDSPIGLLYTSEGVAVSIEGVQKLPEVSRETIVALNVLYNHLSHVHQRLSSYALIKATERKGVSLKIADRLQELEDIFESLRSPIRGQVGLIRLLTRVVDELSACEVRMADMGLILSQNLDEVLINIEGGIKLPVVKVELMVDVVQSVKFENLLHAKRKEVNLGGTVVYPEPH